MFPLGALIAGDPAGAYQQSRQRQQQVDLGDINQEGTAAAARFMQSMVPGATAMPQAPVPGSSPGMNPLQMIAQRLRALGAPQQPPMQMGAPAQPSMGMPAPSGGMLPMPPPMGGPLGGPAVAPSPMPGAGAPPASPAAGSSPGAGQFAAGPRLSLQQAIEGIVRSNPGVKDPRVLFAAVSQMAPLIRMEDQQQFREMQLAMREQLALMQDQRQRDIAGQTESGRERRLQEQLDAAQKRIETLEKGRGERLEKTEAGKGERLEKTEAGKTERFKAKEERLSRESMVRQDRSMQELELKKRALAQRITEQGDRSMLAQWRAVVDAQHKKATEIIAASPTGMDEAERKKLIAEEDKFYREEIEKMRAPKQQAPADTGGEWKVEKVQ